MYYLMLFLFIYILGMTYIITYILFKNKVYKYYYYLFLTGFTIYSGIGIFTEYNKNDEDILLYVFQFLFFIFFFYIGSYFIRKFKIKNKINLENINSYKLIYILGGIYILTYVYKCIYSGIEVEDFFNIKKLFLEYKATPFSIRVARRNDVIYSIMINQVATITQPFYYIVLYNLRKKHKLFISLFILPIFLNLLADSYISRNNIAIYLIFLFIFVYKEKVISRRLTKIISILLIPTLLFIFSILSDIRSGSSIDYTLLQHIEKLILEEVSYPKYYNYCITTSSEISILNFILYIFIVCIPSQIYKFFNFVPPNLAYSFTETILGLNYGETNNYYILLPSVLGEAFILFGEKFAFFYGAIYGIISMLFLKILKKYKYLEYLMIFYLLDFFRQFRGGSQYVISAWETKLIPMIIIMIFMKILNKK